MSASVQADRMRRAIARIEQLEAEVAALRGGAKAPLAFLGLSLRLPGAVSDADGFWRVVREARDVTGEVPSCRWGVDRGAVVSLHDETGSRAGSIRSLRGGWLGPVDSFDATFWGISPREAVGMDPQQRLLLECAWEALEDAGLPPERLRGRRVGVYVGICASDYGQMVASGGLAGIDAYHASGTQHSVASGRIAYALGLRGAAVSVDTACSSSLVALHLASRALRNGECELAIVGGVNLILSPVHSVGFSRAGMLSPDGRCKAFSAGADGYGRAEGCAVVVLSRQSEAPAGRVWAVLRGSAVGQDGASGGLTVPNGPAQAEVIRAALADAGAEPASVGYIEAHGTGTALGDPIEAGALGSVFGAGAGLPIGSAKANLGHAEGAAGLVGVVKAVLMRHHGEVPPHPYAGTPSEHVDWAGSGLRLPGAVEPLGADALVGVSSFGFSGTNAHAVIGPVPAGLGRVAEAVLAGQAGPAKRAGIYAVSARSAGALDGLAAAGAARLAALGEADAAAGGAGCWLAACGTSVRGRQAMAHRRAVVARDAAAAAAVLRGEAREDAWGVAGVAQDAPGLVWLFTGQGALRPGAGLGLVAAEPGFAQAWREVCAAFAPYLPAGSPGLEAVLHGPDAARWLAMPSLAQPAHVALGVALARLWRGRGVEPAVVLGHSLGEYVAAHVAGVLDLDGLARLVAGRGALCEGLAPGGMAATTAGAAEVEAVLAGLPGALAAEASVAADHGAAGSTVAGSAAALGALCGALLERGHASEALAGGQGYHSPLVGPAMAGLAALAGTIPHHAPKLALVSSWSGAVVGGATDPAAYDWAEHWAGHLRGRVRYAQAVAAAVRWLGEGGTVLALEIGAQPVLAGLNRRIVPGLVTLPSIARDTDEGDSIQRTTASLWAQGVNIEWGNATGSQQHIHLPGYAWERTRHWDGRADPFRAGTTRADAVGAFYDDLAQTYAALTERGLADPSVDLHLTYAPFPEIVPGFSWLESIRDPAANPAHLDLMLEAQRRLRRLALRRVDLAGVRRVFDLGCGYGGDLVALARRHPQVEGVGHTASARQAEVAARLAQSRGVAERIAVHHRDSTQHAPEGRFDLALGFEAVHHMADPAALFGHLRQAIAPGGQLVLADLMATGAAIADGKTLSDLPAAEDWAGWLASAGLRLEDATCVSPAIANFLHDPDIEAHIARIGADLPAARRDAVQDAFRGFVRLGRLLREGGARYLLFSARRTDEDAATLRQAARDILATPTRFDAVAPEAWLYEPRWVAAPVAMLPAPRTVATPPAADPAMPDLAPARTALDRVARAYAAEAAGTPAAPDRGRAAGRIAQLAEAAQQPAATLAAQAAATHPEAAREIALLARCGAALPAILRGEAEALPLLFAGDTAAHLYADAPSARRMNGLLAGLLQAATAQWPAGRRLRVLEVGAGTGGTTAALRDALPPDTDYLFTDVSPALLAAAAERFPGIRTAVFDADRAPAAQGLGDARFDIIVAANALHACRDIPATFAHLHGLLAPGGWIALLEATAPAPWVDATFGLTPGWWRFDDALRRDHPLLSAPEWEAALRAAGLTETTTLRPPEALLLDQAVIVARRPFADVTVLGEGPIAQAARAAFGTPKAATTLLDLRALDRDAEDVQGAAADALALLREAGETGLAVWLVTRGAVATRAGEAVPHIAGAPLWGLGLVAALEQPDAPCRLIDLDPRDADPVATLRAALAQADDDDRTAWRGGERFVQRLARRSWPQAVRAEAPAGGAWLVTGGRGGLGLAVAERLAAQGVREIVLAARSAPSAQALALAERLRAVGVTVALPQADFSREADVTALVASITARTRLAGVVHAAGVLDDAAIHAMSPEALARVLAPKALGALHLHAATRDLPPHRFILFSSVAGVLGNAGQANHAAASATLDALAWRRRAQGLHALAIDWGAWEATGAAAARGATLPGVTGFMAADALAVLDRLLAEDATQAMVLPVDWDAFTAARGGVAPLLRGLAAAPAAVAPALPQGAGVPETMAALAAQVLGMPALPDRAAPLAGYGFDSLMAIALRNRIREAFGVDLPLARLVGAASADALAAEVAALRAPSGISADVAAMSDEEVEAALRALAEAPA